MKVDHLYRELGAECPGDADVLVLTSDAEGAIARPVERVVLQSPDVVVLVLAPIAGES